MRLTLAIVALLPALLRADPAGAHVCAVPVEVAVGEPATITVGITAEATAITAVEVGVPPGFRLTGADGAGWRTEAQGGVVRFEGNTVDPFTCGYVSVEGVAEETAKLAFPLTLRTADGGTVTYDGTEPYREDGAQLVYAGLELPGGPGGEGEGVGPLVWVPLVAGAALAVVSAVGWLRSRHVAAGTR